MEGRLFEQSAHSRQALIAKMASTLAYYPKRRLNWTGLLIEDLRKQQQ